MVHGIPVQNEEDAVKAANELGFPVAMKIISKQISHKSDFGGVQLNLRTDPGVVHAYRDMTGRIAEVYPDKEIEGALIQSMITGGRELILGGRQDEHFGPVVMVGLGGIFVEIFGEVSVRVAPISRREAMDMFDGLQGSAIFKGARGTQSSDIEAVVDALLRLSQLLCEQPEVKEIDINPLRVFHQDKGCIALDARIILDRG
jgi:4-hydroxybutyryl-CoA synthetase (ADP-forming)